MGFIGSEEMHFVIKATSSSCWLDKQAPILLRSWLPDLQLDQGQFLFFYPEELFPAPPLLPGLLRTRAPLLSPAWSSSLPYNFKMKGRFGTRIIYEKYRNLYNSHFSPRAHGWVKKCLLQSSESKKEVVFFTYFIIFPGYQGKINLDIYFFLYCFPSSPNFAKVNGASVRLLNVKDQN